MENFEKIGILMIALFSLFNLFCVISLKNHLKKNTPEPKMPLPLDLVRLQKSEKIKPIAHDDETLYRKEIESKSKQMPWFNGG